MAPTTASAASALAHHAAHLAERLSAALTAWAEPRAADLSVAAALAQEALRAGEFPQDVPPRVLRSSAEAGMAALALVTLATSGRARAVARDVLDTAAAVVLLAVMLAVLLGVPLGILYGLYRAGALGAGAAVALVAGKGG